MAKMGLLGGGGQTPPFIGGGPSPAAGQGGMFRRGQGGILPERGSRAQYDMVQELLKSGIASSQGSGSPLLAFLAPMIGGAVGTRTEGLYRNAQGQRDNGAIDKLMAAMGPSDPPVLPGSQNPAYGAMAATGGPTKAAAAAIKERHGSIAPGIAETARALEMDPVDLATIISYETGGTFDPTKRGPTTQWGQHRGLIQFGEPQAREYGVNWEDPVGSQLGADGAVARYFRQNGWQPGMGLLDAYSIVNAGAPGRYDRSDANNGGAPGTVRDKVENQMSGHRKNAMRLLGGDFTAYANAGQPAPMSQDNMRTLIGLMTDEGVSGPIRSLASSMLSDAMTNSGGLGPRDQISLAKDMLGLEAAMAPPKPEPRFRVATPEEAASYGATAGQIGPDGRFYARQEAKPPDEYGRYVSEEQAAGRTPLSRIDYANAKKGKGTVVYDPVSGNPIVSIGGANDDGRISPSSPDAMIASIDGILNDPALDLATGWLAWTQNIPGTSARRFGARASQLEGQAFLQAFESLKGGGQITEIEGQKATQAIGRLDTAQSAEDYRQALTELRDILAAARTRSRGWVQEQANQGSTSDTTQSPSLSEMPDAETTPPKISTDQEYDALPSGATFMDPNGQMRRKP